MRKENYTRRPKKAFRKLKKLYQTELYNKSGSGSSPIDTFSKEDLKEARRKIQMDIIKHNRRSVIVNVVSIVLGITIFFLLLLFAFN